MTVKCIMDETREMIPDILGQISFGEDVEWEALFNLAPTPAGPQPSVFLVLTLPSPILGEGMIGTTLVPLPVAKSRDTLMEALRSLFEQLLNQRSQMTQGGQGPAGGLILPLNGNHPPEGPPRS